MRASRLLWPMITGTLVAGLSMVTAMMPLPAQARSSIAAASAPATPNTYSQSRVQDKTCQNRSNSVRTCEWLFEWPYYNKYTNTHTTAIEAYASMNSTRNMEIYEIKTYFRRCIAPNSCGPVQIAVTSGSYTPSGSGYLQGHDADRKCSNTTEVYFAPWFKFKYFLPKPANEWVWGTAWGGWQHREGKCADLWDQ